MSTVLVEELPTQASVQAPIWWWIDDKASSLCSVSMHDDHISKSAILSNGYVFIFKRFVHTCASEKNGITNEVIVIGWVVSSTSWHFKAVKKWWGCPLLSVKCWCFMHTILN